MADDGSKQSPTGWPIPKFYFEVKWGTEVMSFEEVSGLDSEPQTIDYRVGERFSAVRMPGLQKFGDVTLKKGVFKGDGNFRDWMKEFEMDTVKRETLTISLVDQAGTPTMVWTLKNAFPTKITTTDMKADGNEVAIESIVIAHEGLTIETK